MSNKISQLEIKLQEVESKENKVQEIRKTAKMIDNQKKVSNINTHVPKSSELKGRDVSVFKFGAEARLSVEKKMTSKEFKCEQCHY